MTKIGYYNPKNNKYQYSKVISIEGDTVNCLNTSANYHYQESLKNLIELSKKENPNWHGAIKKPLIIIKYGNYTI